MLFRKKTGEIRWLVVFLGNPGQKYDGTRHNAGFMTSEVFADEHNVRISRIKYHALVGECEIGGERVLLMKPQTYMNLSGDAASEAMRFYRIPTDHMLVVSDDVSLPVGKLRIRRNGSAGGHNGLKDLIAKCGGEGFPRIKIGVGAPPHPDYDMADWVLSRFQGDDADKFREAAHRASKAVEAVITSGVDKAMNEYNS